MKTGLHFSNRDINRAFELAFFILGNQENAITVTKEAFNRLAVSVSAQDKRFYYTPGLRTVLSGTQNSKARTRVMLSELHLLQKLIFDLSEPFERKKEKKLSPSNLQNQMLIHFIKHLMHLTWKRNSFHVALGLTRFLFNYSTAEAMSLYEIVMQNPSRIRDASYWRYTKSQLLDEIHQRFGNCLTITQTYNNEERFASCEDSAQYAPLVRECLQKFSPWAQYRTKAGKWNDCVK